MVTVAKEKLRVILRRKEKRIKGKEIKPPIAAPAIYYSITATANKPHV
jgi:CMP-N-acetylneuraminic acid synthetase